MAQHDFNEQNLISEILNTAACWCHSEWSKRKKRNGKEWNKLAKPACNIHNKIENQLMYKPTILAPQSTFASASWTVNSS